MAKKVSYPTECPVFKIVSPALMWRGMIVEGVGWENWDGEAYIRFFNPEIEDIDGYYFKSMKPLTTAAEDMLAAAIEHVANEMRAV